MKIIKLIAFGILLSLSYSANAQIIVDATIAMEPIWSTITIEGPRYEYYPDQQMYYDRQTYMYVYFNGSSWGRSVYIPQSFINIDFGNARKVRIENYSGWTPYVNIEEHRRLYGRGDNKNHNMDYGNGNSGEHAHENGFRGNENVNYGNVHSSHPNEKENHGGGNEQRGGGEHGGKK